MRVLTLTMLALLTIAPLAAAQDETNKTDEQRPEDAAWVEDCPPDMMCAYGAEDCIECSGPADEPARGPADGSCEYCRGEDAPASEGTCMDGTDPGEICDDDVQYIGGPSSGQPEPVRAPVEDTEDREPKSVPGASFAVVVAAFALAIFLLARRL